MLLAFSCGATGMPSHAQDTPSQDAPSQDDAAQVVTQDPPAKALKYHGVLQKRPSPGYLFDRFFNAWLDDASVESLEAFLKDQAAEQGGSSDGLLLAFFFAKQGEDVLAIEQFRKTLASDPGNAAAWYEKGVLEARTLDFETALTDLDQAAKAKPKEELAVRIAKLRGQLLIRNRQKDEALKVFQTLIDKRPDDEELAEDVIELQLSEGLYDEAAAAAQQLIDRTKDPYRKVLRRLRLGDIRQQGGKRDAAIKIYRDTLSEVGDGSWLEREILAQIERAYRREDDVAALKKQYESLLEDFPRRVGVRRGFARVLADSGESAEAIEQFKAILKITPGDRDNQEAFVQLYLRAGDNAGAKKQLEALIKQNPDDGELYVQLAEVAKQTKEDDVVRRAIDEFLARSDKGEYAYLRAARLLERLEFPQAAKEKYAALTEAFPNSPAAKEAFAAFLYKSGEQQQAIALWKKVASGDDPQQAVRVARALSARQENQAAYDLLVERQADFSRDSLFLAQLIDQTLALKKYSEAAPLARRRVDMATTPAELEDAIAQAAKSVERGELLSATLAELKPKHATPQRACLYAELLERSGDVQQANAVLANLVEAGDLLAVSQQMRLARQRRDWPSAILAARKMIDLPGGRKSRNVRRLVELHERSFQIKKALEWIPEWKKLSPGSTTPWLTESRLLLIDGKPDAAVESLRTAAREFDGATEIRTRLAQLYQSTGKLADAERIYWREYESSEDLIGKLRAVEQLARVADQRGKTTELVDNFEQRRRANRKSIEPLLALATVHRVTDDYEKRLQTLAQAANMRPDDLQLLQQIARIQEREGDWEKARDTLARAMKIDKSSRTRSQLAALHLRWGNAEQGYALLYESLDQRQDPRQVESLVNAMISVGDWERIVEFLAPRVAQWPEDYRLRYLLAIAHEESENHATAVEHFLAVINAEKEINSAAPAPLNQMHNYYEQMCQIAPPGVRNLVEMSQLRYQVYAYRQRRNTVQAYMSSAAMGGGARVTIPPRLDTTQRHAVVHLAAIAQLLEDDQVAALRESLEQTHIAEADVMLEMGGNASNRNIPATQLVEKFPERETVLAFATLGMTGQNTGLDVEFYRNVNRKFRDKYPQLALLASVQGMLRHQELAYEAEHALKLFDAIDEPASITVMMLCTMPAQLQQHGVKLPENVGKKLREKLVAWYPSVRDSQPYGQWIFQYMVGVLRQSDDPKAYVELLDDEVARARMETRSKRNAQAMFGFGRPQLPTLLNPPSFPPTQLQQFPAKVLALIQLPNNGGGFQVYFPGQQQPSAWEEEKLVEHLPSVKDPTLRLLLAHRLKKEQLVKESIEQLLASETPTLDTYLLAAGWHAAGERMEDAIRVLEKARYLPMDRSTRRMIDSQLLALVLTRVSEGQSKEDFVRAGRDAALRLRHGTLQANHRTELARALDDLGLKQEAERLEESTTVARSSSSRVQLFGSRSGSVRTPTDRIRKLIDGGNQKAAAKLLGTEVLATVRQYAGNPMNQSYTRQQYRRLRERVDKYGLIDEILASLDPKESTNHRRVAEYAAVLEAFDKRDQAVEAYTRALELRPREDSYRVRLIAAEVEAEQMEAAEARLKNFGRQGAGLLAIQALSSFQDHNEPLKKRWQWTELALQLLEIEREKSQPELAWAATLRQTLANPQYCSGTRLESLYVPAGADIESSKGSEKEAKRRRELHDRLCREMLTIDRLAVDGFTGLLASHEAAGVISVGGAANNAALPSNAAHAEVDDAEGDEPQEEESESELPKATTAEFVQLAKSALSRAKRSRLSSQAYQNYFVNYSNSTSTVPQRSPGEYLVRHCWATNDWSHLDDELLPKLEDARGDLAGKIKRYRKLFTCPPDEFADAAKTYVRRQVHSQPGVNSSRLEMKAFEVWRDRGLEVDIETIMIGFIKQNQTSPNGAPPFVLEYAEMLATRSTDGSGAERAIAWFDKLAEHYVGPREKRPDYITKHYQRNQIQWGTPNASIHSFANMLNQAVRKGPLMLPTVRFINEGNVEGLVRNLSSSIRTGVRSAMSSTSVDQTYKFLEQAGLMADLDALPLGSETDFYKHVATRLRSIRNNKAGKELRKRLADIKEPTIGVQILRCELEDDDEVRKQLVVHIGRRLEEIEQLDSDRSDALAARLGAIAEKIAKNQDADYAGAVEQARNAFDWLEQRRASGATARSKKIMAAKKFEELKVEAHELDEWLEQILPDLAAGDPKVAAQVYFKVVDLYVDAMGRNAVNMYYSRGVENELLTRMRHRLDDTSPVTTKLYFALLSGPGAERIALNRSNADQFFRPVHKQQEIFDRQAKKAKAGPLGAIKPLYAWLRATFDNHMPPLLVARFNQYKPEELKEIEAWLAEQMVAKEDGGIAEQLRATAQFARAEIERRNLEKESKSTSRLPRGEYSDYFEQILADKQQSLSVRVTLAHTLFEAQRLRLPTTTAQAVARVGAEACGTKIPLSYDLERGFAQNALGLVSDSAGDEHAQAFADAWLQRFVNSKPPASRNGYQPSVHEARDASAIVQMLAVYYQRGDKRAAGQLLNRYEERIGTLCETAALLVREGEIERAAKLIRRRWNELSITHLNPTPVHYNASLHANMKKLVEQLKDTPDAFLAEAAVARLTDLPEQQRGDLPLQNARLESLAKRLGATNFTSSDMLGKSLVLLKSTDAVADLVAEPLAKATARINIANAAATNAPNFSDQVQLLLMHGRQRARQDDPKPLIDLFVALSQDGISNDWRLHNAYRQHSQAMHDVLQQRIDRFAEPQLKIVTEGLQKMIAARNRVGTSRMYRLNMLNAVAYARLGTVEPHKKWLASLGSGNSKYVQQQGADKPIWSFAAKGLDKSDAASYDARVNRLSDLLEITIDAGWLLRKFPSPTALQARGGYQTAEPFGEFFTAEELPKAALAVAAKTPGPGGITWILAAQRLEKAKAHEQAAQAWGEAFAASAGETYEKTRQQLRIKQINSLQQAGDRPAALALLDKALAENTLTPEDRKRYDKLAGELRPTPSDAKPTDEKPDDQEPADQKPADKKPEVSEEIKPAA